MKKICYIVCYGEKFNMPEFIENNGLVIAVDGGYKYLIENGIKPNLVVGDFDSLNYVPENENIIKLPAIKDETDTFYAIKSGISEGCNEFHIYCGTGGRFEHTFANIQCLCYLAKNNYKAILYDKDTIMTAIHNCELNVANGTGYLSVFSLSDKSIGVSIENMKYLLNDYTMTNSFPIGVNNEFIGKPSKIKVTSGTLLIRLPITAKI
ncbi:MAG TPA: thiamine diphosphokinase [Clostridia bacterium]|nr:thiamine diphosphokinase [Clostridia bacterium]